MSRITRQEAHNADLIEELWAMDDPIALELADRMARCRGARERRRALGQRPTLAEAMKCGPQFKCKTVACWACRREHVLRKKRQAAALFDGAANEDASFVTINAAAPCADLDDVAAEHRRFSEQVDNWRDGLTRRDLRFQRVSVFAILEMEHRGGMWLPHWHVQMHHPGVARREICEAARTQWPGARRVQVQQFHAAKSTIDNAERCTGYSFKFRHQDWPTKASAHLFAWIRKRAALRSMCVVLKPRDPGRPTSPTGGGPGLRQAQKCEPMPVVIGSGFTPPDMVP